MADTSRSFRKCCVHVWQRVDGDVHAHDAVTSTLRKLGCSVAARINKDTTHVIFQRIHEPTAKQRQHEDDDLRTIYSRLPAKEPRVYVVNPLWLTKSEKAGAPIKESKYLVQRPAEPLFLTGPFNSGARRRRKSCTARPREAVEGPDIDDPMFSSSQQIRALNEGGGDFFSYGEFHKAGTEPTLSEVEPAADKLPLIKPAGVGAATKLPAAARRPQSETKASVAQPKHLVGTKRGPVQTTLKFAVLTKKPRRSLTGTDGPSTAAQPAQARQMGPPLAVDRRAAHQPATEQGSADSRGPLPVSDFAPNARAQNPSPAVPQGQQPVLPPAPLAPQPARPPAPPAAQPMHQLQQHTNVSKSAAPEPAPNAQQRAAPGPRYPPLPCAVAPTGAVDPSRSAGGSLPDVLGGRNMAGAAPAAPLAALAAAGCGLKLALQVPPIPVGQHRRVVSLPPRMPATHRPDEGGAAGSAAAAAMAATAAVPAAATAAAAAVTAAAAKPAELPAAVSRAGKGDDCTAGQVPPNAGPDVPAAAAPAVSSTGAQGAGRGSAKRRSRSMSGTPLGVALVKSVGRLTPLSTPTGLTPGSIVAPKLKSQGGTTPAGVALTPIDPNKASAAQQAPEAAPAAQAGPSTAPNAHESPAGPRPAPGSGQKPAEAPGQQQAAATGGIAGVPATVTASVRRSARARGLLPPTPPPATLVPVAALQAPAQPPETSNGPRGAAVAAVAERGQTTDASPAPGFDLGRCLTGPAASGTPTLHRTVGTVTRSRAARVEADTGLCAGGQMDGVAADQEGGADTGRRSQRRTRRPLALSPVHHDSTQRTEHAPTPAPKLAVAAQVPSACTAAAAPAPAVGAATTAAPAVGGQTPGSVLRRSGRLLACSPLVSAPPNPLPQNCEGDEKVKAPVVQLGDCRQQQEQQQLLLQSPGLAWAGFQPLVQQRPQEASQLHKAQSRELAGLLRQGPLRAAPPEEGPAGAAGCTPATGRKTRRREQAPTCEDSVGAQQEHRMHALAPASGLRLPAQQGGPSHEGPPVLAVVLPSPALCTRSRARGAATTPRLVLAGAAEQQPQQPEPDVPPQPKQRPSPGRDGSLGRLWPSDVVASELRAPPSTRGRLGSVTRSRRRAIESELAGAAEVPPSPVAKGGRATALARAAAALLEAAALTADAAKDDGAAGSSVPADVPGPPATEASTAPAAAVAPPALPPRPTPACRRGSGSGIGPRERLQLCPVPAAPAEGAASGSAGLEPRRPAAAESTPRRAAASSAPAAAACSALRTGAPRPPRSSARKRPLEAPSPGARVVDKGTDSSNGAAPVAAAVASGAPDPTAATRPQARPMSRSRLRLRKQEGETTLNSDDGTATQDGAAASGTTAVVEPGQGPSKRRRTGPSATPKAPKDSGKDSRAPAPEALAAGAAAQGEQGVTEAADKPGPATAAPPARGESGARRAAVDAGEVRGCAVEARKLASAQRQPTSGVASAIRPGDLQQRAVFRSTGLTPLSAGAGAHRPTSVFSGAAANRANRLGSSLGAAAGATGVLEPSPAAEAAAAPALGQYPRGKEHPMRAGYRYLASTRVGKEMEATIEKAIKQLGNARVCPTGYEDRLITHLVVGEEATRTVKVLIGIANGARLVRPSWVEASVAAGEWVPEEEHMVQNAFAATANVVRERLQAQQHGAGGAAGAGAAGVSAMQAGVVARPLAGRMVTVHVAQCTGPGLGELQKRKGDLEKLVVALGGRVAPARSAGLLVVVGGSASQADRRQTQVQVASEEWLKRLAETHVWQEPST